MWSNECNSWNIPRQKRCSRGDRPNKHSPKRKAGSRSWAKRGGQTSGMGRGQTGASWRRLTRETSISSCRTTCRRKHMPGVCSCILHPDHAVHWKSLGSHRQCATWLVHGSVASALLPCVLHEEQRQACRDDAGSVTVSVGHERRGQQSGDDGTEYQEVRETRASACWSSSRLAS